MPEKIYASLILWLCLVEVAQAACIGQTLSSLLLEKGLPRSQMTCGDRLVLLYPESTVHLCDGVVTKILWVKDCSSPRRSTASANHRQPSVIPPPVPSMVSALSSQCQKVFTDVAEKAQPTLPPSPSPRPGPTADCEENRALIAEWTDATPLPAYEAAQLTPTYSFPANRLGEIARPGTIARPAPVRYPADRSGYQKNANGHRWHPRTSPPNKRK